MSALFADDDKPTKKDRSDRFVQDSTDGIMIDGVPWEEYMERPETKKAVEKSKADKSDKK